MERKRPGELSPLSKRRRKVEEQRPPIPLLPPRFVGRCTKHTTLPIPLKKRKAKGKKLELVHGIGVPRKDTENPRDIMEYILQPPQERTSPSPTVDQHLANYVLSDQKRRNLFWGRFEGQRIDREEPSPTDDLKQHIHILSSLLIEDHRLPRKTAGGLHAIHHSSSLDALTLLLRQHVYDLLKPLHEEMMEEGTSTLLEHQ